MTIDDTINYSFDDIHSSVISEVNKIINICKYYKQSRDYIVTEKKYSSDQKISFLNVLDALFQSKTSSKIRTSSYDSKPYVLTFFNDFLEFIIKNNLSQNELKVCMGLYSILHDSNTYGNVLLSYSNSLLSEKSNVNITNLSKTIKSLCDKNILVKKDKQLYLNYSFFYRGSKVDYDRYVKEYDSIKTTEFTEA